MFSTVFVLTTLLRNSSLTIYFIINVISSLTPNGRLSTAPQPKTHAIQLLGILSAVPPLIFYRRPPVRSFAKNQLSLGTISISHLTTSHRRIMQHSPVRSLGISSTPLNLDMVRSPSFWSNIRNLSNTIVK